ALAVVASILLQAKQPLHRLVRESIREGELRDALLLAAAALVVLPLLPDHPIDPWGALRPALLWKFVVLVMAVGMLGHVALRAVGARWGLAIAGFFAGFASSTAAVAGFGGRVREQPALRTSAVAAALLSNVASLLLFAAILGVGAPHLLQSMALPLAAAGLVLLAGGALGLRSPDGAARPRLPPQPRVAACRGGRHGDAGLRLDARLVRRRRGAARGGAGGPRGAARGRRHAGPALQLPCAGIRTRALGRACAAVGGGAVEVGAGVRQRRRRLRLACGAGVGGVGGGGRGGVVAARHLNS